MTKSFKVDISEEILQNIYSKVKNYQLHEMPDDGGWDYGTHVERIYNVQQWTEMPEGGHFAALEKPELLIKDIIKFSKTINNT